MTRHTTVSLLAAAALGVIMAVATVASGEAMQGAPINPQPTVCGTPTYRACMARCAPAGSPPEQQARCERQCADREDPLDCIYVRHPQTVAPTNTVQGPTVRRR